MEGRRGGGREGGMEGGGREGGREEWKEGKREGRREGGSLLISIVLSNGVCVSGQQEGSCEEMGL